MLSTGRVSASRNSQLLHTLALRQGRPGGLAHRPAGGGVPSGKGAPGSIAASATAGRGQGRLQSCGTSGQSLYVAQPRFRFAVTTRGVSPPSTTCQHGASVSSPITFQGNYIIGKGLVLRYPSALNKRTQNNKIKSDHFPIPRTNNGWRPGSSMDDKTTGERLTGNLIRDGSGRRGEPTVKINVTKTGHRKF